VIGTPRRHSSRICTSWGAPIQPMNAHRAEGPSPSLTLNAQGATLELLDTFTSGRSGSLLTPWPETQSAPSCVRINEGFQYREREAHDPYFLHHGPNRPEFRIGSATNNVEVGQSKNSPQNKIGKRS